MHEFKIPAFEYINMGGKYSGCKRGTALDDFSFEIIPDKENSMEVFIWHNAKCRELSEVVATSVFEKNEDGYNIMLDFIEERYQIWLKNHEILNELRGYFCKN